uniref:Major facilitator superfamily (MFS) profile domain-containing protein n=1 Tax=Periophthalmus magnuspinnatus TaxID=409849 RepID=A0A3B3ZU89_9GOBI
LESMSIDGWRIGLSFGWPYQYGFSISSMTSPSVFIQELVNITCVERYGVNLEKWQISLIWSFIVSIFCMGGLSLSALLANSLISKFGRKKLLLLNNIPALIGAVLMLLSKTAMSFEMIMAARFLQGMNAGLGLITNTIYLVECAPKRLRGAVGVTVALFISFGKFSGQLLGISELFGTRERWPWLLGFTGLTSLLQLVTLPLLPESPSFLLLATGDQQASLKRLWGDRNYQLEMEEMLKEKVMQKNAGTQTVLQLLRNHDIRWQLLSVIVIFSSLQLCGINAVYFYSYEVFRQVGIGEENLRYAALGTGLCELSASSSLVSRTRSPQCCWVWNSTTVTFENHYMYGLNLDSFAAGVSTPVPGELFTQAYKSAAFTVGTTVNWIGLFCVGMLFPILVEKIDYFCFLIFLIFCVSTCLYMRFCFPEINNLSPLEIAAEFKKMHTKSEKTPSSLLTKYNGTIQETKF